MTLRLAFMGAPDFAAPSLAEIAASGHEIAAVYTQPPRPAGRGQSPRKTPVHELAEALGLPVRTPARLANEDEEEAFAALDLDAAIVVAYGLLLPRIYLETPRFGCLNLHPSLLPRWRGAAPIQRAIMAGDPTTAVQIMRMEESLDTGPILLSETAAIEPGDTAGALHDRLARTGAQMWPRALAALERGALAETRQEEEGASYAAKISKSEARIDWTRPAREIDRKIRGLSPFPGAWFEIETGEGRKKGPVRVKALNSVCVPSASGPPGAVLDADMLIACGEGAVRLTRLQREGRPAMDAETFLRGVSVLPGQHVR